VLPLALLVAILLFIVGCFMANTFTEPLVSPVKPIEIIEENYFLIPFTFAIVAILYWEFTQYQYKFGEVKPLKVFVTLLVYGVGLLVVLGLDTTAFRLGTIVWTSTFLMPENDLKYVEGNDFFMYGFFPHDSIKEGQEIEYFENDTIFKKLREQEDSILEKRYIENAYNLDRTYLSHLSYNSMPLDIVYHSDKSFGFFKSNESVMYDTSGISYESYRSDILNKSYLSAPLDISNMLAYHPDLAYRLYRSYRSELSGLSKLSDNDRFVKDNNIYQTYYKTCIFPQLDTNRLDGYGLNFSFEEFKCEDLIFDKPQYFYTLEDCVRAVRHAQQFLNEGIIYRYFKILLQYFPFTLLLFFVVSFSSQRNFLAALVISLIIYFSLDYFCWRIECGEIVKVYLSYRMEGLAILSLIITFLSIFSNHENRITNFFLHLFIVATGAALIPAFIENIEKYGTYYIKANTFYLTAVMCLIAPVLFSYLKGLPKSR